MEDTTKKPVTLDDFPLSPMTLYILENGGKPKRLPSILIKQTPADPAVMAVVRKSKEAKKKKKKKK